MKTLIRLSIALGCILFSFSMSAQIIATEMSPDGVLVPRMTTAQKEAIVNKVQSLLVYDTDTKSFWYYQDMQWNELAKVTPPLGNNASLGEANPNAPIIDGDLAGVSSTISLDATGNVTSDTQIEICMNISHNYLGDVDVTLTASDGSTILDLTSDNSGSNYTNTCFTTSATVNITSGASPYTGEFTPKTPFPIL